MADAGCVCESDQHSPEWGFVSARAKPDDMRWEDEFDLCGSEHCEHGGSSPKVEKTAVAGWDKLAVTSTGTEEVAEFGVAPADALGGGKTLEPSHTSNATFRRDDLVQACCSCRRWSDARPAARGCCGSLLDRSRARPW